MAATITQGANLDSIGLSLGGIVFTGVPDPSM
jgi:hypothetical protein